MRKHEHEKASRSADALAQSALVIQDFDVAGDALLALTTTDKDRARDVALKILHDRIGDVFYQALAFEMLYDVSLADAVAYIQLNAMKESAYVFGAMLSSVAEDVNAPDGRDQIVLAVSVLRKALALRSAKELDEISKKRAWFEKTYPE